MSKHTFLKIFGWMMTLALLPTQSLAQQFQTIGPAGCGLGQNDCHAKENKWWTNDDHYSTADPFFSPTGKYNSISQKYGIKLTDAPAVNKSCMNCHGTVISAKATREVEFGVSCESCHGPGSGYKDPHAVPKGYAQGLKFGMIDNKNLNTRAISCVDCHYITEKKLIDAGHPTGEDFDYVTKGIKQVAKHWRTHGAESPAQLQPAFDKAMKAKGPAPVAASAPKSTPTPPPTAVTSPAPAEKTAETATPPPPPKAVAKKAAAPKKQTPVYQEVIEPPSPYKTLGPGSCGLGQNECHAKENDWWKNDDHYVTQEAFYEPRGKYVDYAKRYGIELADLAKGNKNCMKCHGTVITAKANQEVEYGVSCESCHGGGSDYRDPHTEKPGGYENALKLGMVENKNLDIRAKTCVRCHYITEPKLVSIGHSTGENFDYIKGIKQISKPTHWKRAAKPEDLAEATFAKAMQAKGPVVQIVEVEGEEPAAEETEVMPEQPSPVPQPRPVRIAPAPPAPRPVSPLAMPENLGPLDLAPFPSVSDSTSLQNLILILKKRLEYLYQKTGGGQ